MVVTIHDLTFEHHPEWFRPAARAAFRAQARHAARSARAILTVSQHVRDDIVDTYGVDPQRILVATNAVDPVFRPGGANPAADLGVSSPYVVALGGAPRRNASLAVQAWRCATGGLVPLVVVGAQRGPEPSGVHHTGPLPDPQWAGLLAGAAAFLYPTGYEGFGMPALEAAACGTPVVCAPVGALPEVMGAAPAWADSLDPDALAEALSRVLDDADYAEDRRARGLARAAAAPGWDRCAAVHLEAYHRAG
jgi:glycosyltransferase involved in cell wall biosynthesis